MEHLKSNSRHGEQIIRENSDASRVIKSHSSQISLRKRCKKMMNNQSKEQFTPVRHFRWRMLSRILVYFLRWERLKNLGKDRGFVMRRMVAGRVQERVFNVEHFSKLVQQHQILNTHAKLLLYKEPELRSSHDIVVILGYFNRMSCFSKYSVFTKRLLASKVRYSCYTKGTVIFTEGSYPLFFYLVLSGSVQLYFKTDSKHPEETVLKPHGSLIKEGMGFGELGIVNNERRSATAIVTDHGEFFTLDKEEFKKLLLEYHDEERTMKSNMIRQIPETTGVPEADVKKAIDTSFIRSFAKGDIIINGQEHSVSEQKEKGSALDTYLSVVVTGSAVLEKRIHVCQQYLPAGTTTVSYPNQSRRDALVNFPDQLRPEMYRIPMNLRAKYLSVRTYIPGDVFTPIVYECEYVIGAKEATTVLFIPRTPFMIHKQGEPMLQLYERLSTTNITVTQLIKEYNAARLWLDYKKQLITQILHDKRLRRI